jgi:alpha-galactosidase
VAVHEGDYFAALECLSAPDVRTRPEARGGPASAYEPIWCAWGYERDCTTALIEGTLPKVKELGLEWAVIDDGWQAMIGDWTPIGSKYPNGEPDMRALVADIRAAGLKPRLWYSPLSVAPGSDFLHDHADMLLLDKNGAVQNISWWNSFYLCPGYAPTVEYTQRWSSKFIGDWGFAGLKIDGQHLNNVAPCFNPAHHHERPEESVEGLQTFFHAPSTRPRWPSTQYRDGIMPVRHRVFGLQLPLDESGAGLGSRVLLAGAPQGQTLKGLMGPARRSPAIMSN